MNVRGKHKRQLVDQALGRHGNPPIEEVRTVTDRVWETLKDAPALEEEPAAGPERALPAARVWRVALVAAGVVLAISSIAVVRNFGGKIQGQAFVDTAGDGLQRFTKGDYREVRRGDAIGFGEVIRSGGDSGSSLILKDRSRIEMRSKSELKLEPAGDGVRIQLNTGGVIVTAAEQPSGHLYVRTRDLTASVIGTVFVVNAEEAGSRVAVLQGEVRVDQGATFRKLLPGQQIVTNPLMEPRSVVKDVSWSRNEGMLLAQLRQATAPAAAPPKRLEFEVASIKPESPLGGADAMGREYLSPECQGADGFVQLPDLGARPPNRAPRGRCVGRHVSLVRLIGLAYGLQDWLVKPSLIQGPEWAHDGIRSGFQLDAKAENPETATKQQLREMLQNLLADRFKLKVSWQTTELPGFVLSLGKGGSKLQEALSEETLKETTRILEDGSQRAIAGKASLGTFADFMMYRPPLNGVVRDRTGLTGTYTFNLTYFVPSLPPAEDRAGPGRRSGADPVLGYGPAYPYLRDALQAQLGLRVEQAKVPTDYVVIEHVEKPSEN